MMKFCPFLVPATFFIGRHEKKRKRYECKLCVDPILKVILFAVVFFCGVGTLSAQRKGKPFEKLKLVVYSITEYIDGYSIQAIDTCTADTFKVLNAKDNFKPQNGYEKIVVGKEYYFDVFNDRYAAPPMSPGHFAIRLRRTIIWTDRESITKMPVFARNMKDLYIDLKTNNSDSAVIDPLIPTAYF